MMKDKGLTDDVLDEIIAGAKTSMEQYLALSLKAERAAKQKSDSNSPVTPDGWISCSERMPNDKQYVWCWGKSYGWTECDTFEGITIGRETNGGQLLTMGKSRHRK